VITVVFTDRAKESLAEILNFLRERWTQKQIDEFYSDMEQLISTIDDNILKHPYYKNSKIRKALIARRQISVFYKETGPVRLLSC